MALVTERIQVLPVVIHHLPKLIEYVDNMKMAIVRMEMVANFHMAMVVVVAMVVIVVTVRVEFRCMMCGAGLVSPAIWSSLLSRRRSGGVVRNACQCGQHILLCPAGTPTRAVKVCACMSVSTVAEQPSYEIQLRQQRHSGTEAAARQHGRQQGSEDTAGAREEVTAQGRGPLLHTAFARPFTTLHCFSPPLLDLSLLCTALHRLRSTFHYFVLLYTAFA